MHGHSGSASVHHLHRQDGLAYKCPDRPHVEHPFVIPLEVDLQGLCVLVTQSAEHPRQFVADEMK